MKLSWSFALSSLYCSASAASQLGHVFIYDPVATKSEPLQASVNPETARLILAQRLGVSQFHSIDNPSEEVIDLLNAYGGRQHKLLFGDDSLGSDKRPETRVLVWIEDVEDISSIIPDAAGYSGQFTITNPPAGDDNDQLLQDFAQQAESLPPKEDPSGLTYTAALRTEETFRSLKAVDLHNGYLSVFRADKSDELSNTKLSATLSELLSNSEDGTPITVVLMPPTSKLNKRDGEDDPYGILHLPPATDARRPKSEELLSPTAQPSETPFEVASNNNVSNMEDFPIVTAAKKGAPILGILPACFQSKDACEKQTNGCSNHGVCVKSNQTSTDKREACYSCACVPTVEMVGGGGMEESKKTTYWGGPACQKKDVSVPFFLFVATGVLLAFLISAGIGMLYSMGSEELPSVIGAGVSGPQKK